MFTRGSRVYRKRTLIIPNRDDGVVEAQEFDIFKIAFKSNTEGSQCRQDRREKMAWKFAREKVYDAMRRARASYSRPGHADDHLARTRAIAAGTLALGGLIEALRIKMGASMDDCNFRRSVMLRLAQDAMLGLEIDRFVPPERLMDFVDASVADINKYKPKAKHQLDHECKVKIAHSIIMRRYRGLPEPLIKDICYAVTCELPDLTEIHFRTLNAYALAKTLRKKLCRAVRSGVLKEQALHLYLLCLIREQRLEYVNFEYMGTALIALMFKLNQALEQVSKVTDAIREKLALYLFVQVEGGRLEECYLDHAFGKMVAVFQCERRRRRVCGMLKDIWWRSRKELSYSFGHLKQIIADYNGLTEWHPLKTCLYFIDCMPWIAIEKRMTYEQACRLIEIFFERKPMRTVEEAVCHARSLFLKSIISIRPAREATTLIMLYIGGLAVDPFHESYLAMIPIIFDEIRLSYRVGFWQIGPTFTNIMSYLLARYKFTMHAHVFQSLSRDILNHALEPDY